MPKSVLGLAIGGPCGALSGFVAGMVAEPNGPRTMALGFVLAVLAAPPAAIAGAVVGGVADIIAFLKERLPAPVALTPEDDYRDRPDETGRNKNQPN
jgi:hypothetical protein